MNENDSYLVKELKTDNPIITDMDSVLDICFN